MKKFFTCCAACIVVSLLFFTSCKSVDDKEELDVNVDTKDLVTGNVPKTQGWSGNSENGVWKYATDDYDAEDINTYFAFKMNNGTCEAGVYNVVMPNANMAGQLAKMLNDGTWIEDFEDDSDDYSTKYRASANMVGKVIRFISRTYSSRSQIVLPIKVRQEGKVVYVTIPNIKGLSSDDIRTIVQYWNGNSYELPNKVLFGQYENGVYSCKNMHCMNIDYFVTTQFNGNGLCTKYVTKISLPTSAWAQFYYENLEDTLDEYEIQFGKRPTLTINGNTVTLDAIIIGDVTHEDVDLMIYYLDWANNCPFLFSLFE